MIRRNKVTGESKSIRPAAAERVNAGAGRAARRTASTGTRRCCFSPTRSGRAATSRRINVFRSTDRGDSWTADQSRSHDNANRDDVVTMGLKGSGRAHLQATTASSRGRRSCRSPNRRSSRGCTTPARTTASVSMSTDGGKTWDKTLTNRMPGFRQAARGCRRSMPSRYDAATVYVTSDAHRLNDFETAHLGEPRFRRDVPARSTAI